MHWTASKYFTIFAILALASFVGMVVIVVRKVRELRATRRRRTLASPYGTLRAPKDSELRATRERHAPLPEEDQDDHETHP